jgi:tetratricopeptide (TPR) repeat protein
MYKTTIFFLLLFSFSCLFSQNELAEIQALFEEQSYDKAIQLGEQSEKPDAEILFYLGLCYAEKKEEQKAISFFNQAIEKNPSEPTYYFHKSLSLLMLQKYSESMLTINKGINIRNDDPRFFGIKGELFYRQKQYDSAFQCYSYGIRLQGCPRRPFQLLMEIAEYQNNILKAQKVLQIALEDIDSLYPAFDYTLFYLAECQYKLKNYEKEETLLARLLQRNPQNFEAMEKMIQLFYAKKEYEKADYWRKKLYIAHRLHQLPAYLDDEFCFDVMEWNNRKIIACERYDENDNFYYKHVFYVVNKEGEIEQQIQTEYSKAVKDSKKQYVMGKTDGKFHATYFKLLLDKNFEYKQLQEYVMSILTEKEKATSTSLLKKERKKHKK